MQSVRCHIPADGSLTVSVFAKHIGYRPISEYFFSLNAVCVVVGTFNLPACNWFPVAVQSVCCLVCLNITTFSLFYWSWFLWWCCESPTVVVISCWLHAYDSLFALWEHWLQSCFVTRHIFLFRMVLVGGKYYNHAEDIAWRDWIGFVLPRIGTSDGHLWHGHEPSDFIKRRVFAD